MVAIDIETREENFYKEDLTEVFEITIVNGMNIANRSAKNMRKKFKMVMVFGGKDVF